MVTTDPKKTKTSVPKPEDVFSGKIPVKKPQGSTPPSVPKPEDVFSGKVPVKKLSNTNAPAVENPLMQNFQANRAMLGAPKSVKPIQQGGPVVASDPKYSYTNPAVGKVELNQKQAQEAIKKEMDNVALGTRKKLAMSVKTQEKFGQIDTPEQTAFYGTPLNDPIHGLMVKDQARKVEQSFVNNYGKIVNRIQKEYQDGSIKNVKDWKAKNPNATQKELDSYWKKLTGDQQKRFEEEASVEMAILAEEADKEIKRIQENYFKNNTALREEEAVMQGAEPSEAYLRAYNIAPGNWGIVKNAFIQGRLSRKTSGLIGEIIKGGPLERSEPGPYGVDMKVRDWTEQEIAQKTNDLLNLQRELSEVPQSIAMHLMGKYGEQESEGVINGWQSFAKSAGVVASNPSSMGEMFVQSTVAAPEALIFSTIGGLLTGGSGFIAGSFLGGLTSEQVTAFTQAAQESGVDLSSPESVRKLFTDQKLQDKVRGKVDRRSIAMGTVNALFAVVSQGIVKKFDGSKFKQFAVGTPTELIGEGAGEASAIAASGGDISGSEIAMEVFGGAGTNITEIAGLVKGNKIRAEVRKASALLGNEPVGVNSFSSSNIEDIQRRKNQGGVLVGTFNNQLVEVVRKDKKNDSERGEINTYEVILPDGSRQEVENVTEMTKLSEKEFSGLLTAKQTIAESNERSKAELFEQAQQQIDQEVDATLSDVSFEVEGQKFLVTANLDGANVFVLGRVNDRIYRVVDQQSGKTMTVEGLRLGDISAPISLDQVKQEQKKQAGVDYIPEGDNITPPQIGESYSDQFLGNLTVMGYNPETGDVTVKVGEGLLDDKGKPMNPTATQISRKEFDDIRTANKQAKEQIEAPVPEAAQDIQEQVEEVATPEADPFDENGEINFNKNQDEKNDQNTKEASVQAETKANTEEGVLSDGQVQETTPTEAGQEQAPDTKGNEDVEVKGAKPSKDSEVDGARAQGTNVKQAEAKVDSEASVITEKQDELVQKPTKEAVKNDDGDRVSRSDNSGVTGFDSNGKSNTGDAKTVNKTDQAPTDSKALRGKEPEAGSGNGAKNDKPVKNKTARKKKVNPVSEKLSKANPSSLREAVLQHFATGGKIQTESFKKETGFGAKKGKDGSTRSRTDFNKRIWAWKNDGPTMDNLVQSIMETMDSDMSVNIEEDEVRNEIIGVLTEYDSKGKMREDLVEAFSVNDQIILNAEERQSLKDQAAYEEMVASQLSEQEYQYLENDPYLYDEVYELTDEEAQRLLDVEADYNNWLSLYYNEQQESQSENPTSQESDSRQDEERAAEPSEKVDTSQLQDAGEKIGGAKKDLVSILKDATEGDIRSKPLSKTFPEPDYQKLVSDGSITVEGAISMRYLYKNIPSKPRNKYKLDRWVNTVQNAITTITDIVENKQDFHGAIINSKSYIAESFKMYSDTLKGLGFPVTIPNLGNYEIKKFSGSTKPYTIVSGNVIVSRDHETFEGALQSLKTLLSDNQQETKANTVSFDLYQDRTTKEYFVGKKKNKDVIRLMQGFKTLKEADAYRKENATQLQEMWDALKVKVEERGKENRTRIGADYRNGKNISSTELMETFGFRGVEFGNWVEGKARQENVNEAYDALMDLAVALNLSPKSISLNGGLGLAFGARGSGKAMAHYESNKVVINLTKTKGAGSLAHEWWHALDNYFGKKRGENEGFLTDNPRVRKVRSEDGKNIVDDTRVRKEVVEAFKNVMDAMRSTDLKKRSRKLDGTRSKDYWSTPIEMSARSFENYIIEKLGKSSQQNDYLANFKETSEWINQGGLELDNYPYPLKEESATINEAFDQFFNTVEERETDSGVELFQKVDTVNDTVQSSLDMLPYLEGTDETNATSTFIHPNKKSNQKKVEKQVRKALKNWKNAPEIVVLDTHLDFAVKMPVQARRAQTSGSIYSVSAFFNPEDNKLYFIASHPKFEGKDFSKQVNETTLHETLGHYGLRGSVDALNGDVSGLRKTLDSVVSEMDITSLDKIAKVYTGTDFNSIKKGSSSYYEILEEYIAHKVQEEAWDTPVQKVVEWFKSLLEKMGITLDNSQLRYVINNARKFVEVGQKGDMVSRPSSRDLPKQIEGFPDAFQRIKEADQAFTKRQVLTSQLSTIDWRLSQLNELPENSRDKEINNEISDLEAQKSAIRFQFDLFGNPTGQQQQSDLPLTKRQELNAKLKTATKRLAYLRKLPIEAKSNLVKDEIEALQKDVIRINDQLADTLREDQARAGGEQTALFQISDTKQVKRIDVDATPISITTIPTNKLRWKNVDIKDIFGSEESMKIKAKEAHTIIQKKSKQYELLNKCINAN